MPNFYLCPYIKSVLKLYIQVASLVHVDKASEKTVEYDFVVICDTS
jgi:hypothetical protein